MIHEMIKTSKISRFPVGQALKTSAPGICNPDGTDSVQILFFFPQWSEFATDQ